MFHLCTQACRGKRESTQTFFNFLKWWTELIVNFNEAFTVQITALYFHIFLILHLKNV